MKKVVVYRAFDGEDFNTENECHIHEHLRCNEMIDTLKQIHEICTNHGVNCNGCPFYDGVSCIVAQITKAGIDEEISPNMWNGNFILH